MSTFRYISEKSIFSRNLNNPNLDNLDSALCCDCYNDCYENPEACTCIKLNNLNSLQLPGKNVSILDLDKIDFKNIPDPKIFFCGDLCNCNKKKCKNFGSNWAKFDEFKNDFSVFYTFDLERNWSVKTNYFIKKGQFIGKYGGALTLLTRIPYFETLREIGKSYFMPRHLEVLGK